MWSDHLVITANKKAFLCSLSFVSLFTTFFQCHCKHVTGNPSAPQVLRMNGIHCRIQVYAFIAFSPSYRFLVLNGLDCRYTKVVKVTENPGFLNTALSPDGRVAWRRPFSFYAAIKLYQSDIITDLNWFGRWTQIRSAKIHSISVISAPSVFALPTPSVFP